VAAVARPLAVCGTPAGGCGHQVQHPGVVLLTGAAGRDQALDGLGLPYHHRMIDVSVPAQGDGVDNAGLQVPGAQPVRRGEHLEARGPPSPEGRREVQRRMTADEDG